MIRVRKRPELPPRLRDNGPALSSALCDQYSSAPEDYKSGERAFSFSATGYGHWSIKRVLRRDQHDKCCYCESRFVSTAAGDVEHFRPKHYSQQHIGAKKNYPGYFWLAYTWDNLFYSCEMCNRSYKRNLFPLVDETKRALDHRADLTAERPLLLCPLEDAREHIRFCGETPVPLTKRGQATIECIGLDRPALEEDRRTRLTEIRRISDVVALLRSDKRPDAETLLFEAKAFLADAVKPHAIFSSMAFDCLSGCTQ